MKTTQEVAERFEELAKAGRFVELLHELYDEQAVSLEPADAYFENATGKANIFRKGKAFHDSVAVVNEDHISNLIIAADYFACNMRMDFLLKNGARLFINELAVYKVVWGKIVSETFYY